MTEQYDPIDMIDAIVMKIRSQLRLEAILPDLCKIALAVNIKSWGDPPDYEVRLQMRTGVYVGMALDLRRAILIALARARETLEGAKNAKTTSAV